MSIQALRQLLMQDASKQVWKKLCCHFEKLDAFALEIQLTYAMEHLEHWSDEIRHFELKVSRKELPNYFPLVRSLTLHIKKTSLFHRFSAENFSQITELVLKSPASVTLLGLEMFHQLKKLRLEHQVSDLELIASVESLEKLEITGTKKLSSLDGLGKAKNLRKLLLPYADELLDISRLQELPNLEELDLYGASKLCNVDVLSEVKNLKHLQLGSCHNIQGFDFLHDLTQIETLQLAECRWNHAAEAFRGMKRCWSLDLGNCLDGDFTELSFLSQLENVEYLRLYCSEHLESLSGLGGLEKLRVLDVGYCPRLSNIDALVELPSLEYLNLRGASSLKEPSMAKEYRTPEAIDEVKKKSRQ